jgi:nucleotide-binding universal stress UspA family protein
MFERILVPLDGSARAERALPVAARLARAACGTVVLVQVADVHPEGRPHVDIRTVGRPLVIHIDMQTAREYLESLTGAEALQGVSAVSDVRTGPVAATIANAATEHGADLIVICSHGRTGLTRRVLGSVAREVLRHAPVPTLVLQEADPAVPQPGKGRPWRALVALDGSPMAESAIEPAACLIAALAAPSRGELRLVQVLDPMYQPFAAEPWSGEQDVAPSARTTPVDEARAYLSGVATRLRESPLANLNLSIAGFLAFNRDAAEGISQEAEWGAAPLRTELASRCDFIAMSTYGRGGLTAWALGVVTERVLADSTLPLLVVRPGPATAGKVALAPTAERTDALALPGPPPQF